MKEGFLKIAVVERVEESQELFFEKLDASDVRVEEAGRSRLRTFSTFFSFVIRSSIPLPIFGHYIFYHTGTNRGKNSK